MTLDPFISSISYFLFSPVSPPLKSPLGNDR
jgi:hypothetical protein